eukprot:Nk52_evm1s1089 gene=Nk52_evmTU1s1089
MKKYLVNAVVVLLVLIHLNWRASGEELCTVCKCAGTDFICENTDISGTINSSSTNAVYDFSNYTTMTFYSSGMTGFPAGFFSSASQLQNVMIQNNPLLESLPEDFLVNSPNLANVEITNNGLLSVPKSLVVGVKSSALYVLLDNNNISSVSDGALSSIDNLAVFSLRRNQLLEITLSSALKDISGGNAIDVSENRIQRLNSFPDYVSNASFTLFNVSRNKLTNGEGFNNSVNMSGSSSFASHELTLDFSYNLFNSIPYFLFLGNFNLNMSGNPIYSLDSAPSTPVLNSLYLRDTPDLHILPKNFLSTFRTEAVIHLGSALSCCAIGDSNLNFYSASSGGSTVQSINCYHNGEIVSTYPNNLYSEFVNDPTYCQCASLSCAPNATCNIQSDDYAICTCDGDNCYDFSLSPNSNDGTGSESWHNSVWFICVVSIFAALLVITVIAYFVWRRKKSFAAKQTQEELEAIEKGNNYYNNYPGDFSGSERYNRVNDQLGSSLYTSEEKERDIERHDNIDLIYDDEPIHEGMVGPYVIREGQNQLFINVDLDTEPPEVPQRNSSLTIGNVRRIRHSTVDKEAAIQKIVEDNMNYDHETYIPYIAESLNKPKESQSDNSQSTKSKSNDN